MDALFSDYEAIRKSGLFDPEYYLATYPDVAERNVDPLVHYLEEGAVEGRNPHPDFDAGFYLDQCRERGEKPTNPLMHYLRTGAARGLKTRPDGAAPKRRARRQQANDKARNKAADDRTVRPPVLVAIESLGVVGSRDGLCRLSVGGWALAGAPISEITVFMDGQVMGGATYGLPRPDVAALYPDRAEAGKSGFVLAFELPAGASGIVEPVLVVRTADGEVGQRTLPVEIPPQELQLDVVDPLDPAAAKESAGKLPMQLYLDSVAVDPGGILRVDGWAACLVQIEAVEAFLGGDAIGKAEFGLARIDVEKLLPDYPNSRFSGFRLLADVADRGPGRQMVTIRATARGDVRGEASAWVEIPLLSRSARAARQEFHYRCEETTLSLAGRIALRGWAVGPAPVAAIEVLLDGKDVGEAVIGIDRPEIGNLFPIMAHARQPGFSFDADTREIVSGEHTLTLRFHCLDGEVHEVELPVVATRSQRTGGGADRHDERLLHLDEPAVVDGAVETPVHGNLVIAGWALARAGVEAIDIAIDGAPIATADYGLRRLDVHAALPEWDNTLGSGYQALIPHRALAGGSHTVTVTLRDKAGGSDSLEFRIEVEDIQNEAGPWALRRKMAQAEIDLDLRILERCGVRPTFTAILPIRGDADDRRRAQATIASLAAQAYPEWRVLAVTSSGIARDELIAASSPLADRVEVRREPTIAELAALATEGETFVTVLAVGDELGCDAFLELAVAAALDRDADFLYSDERSLNVASGKIEAYFKPQWSPDLLLSTNYIGRLWCARADLFAALPDQRERLLRHGEYDLVLRCTESARAIRHVPSVLCERAAPEADGQDDSQDDGPGLARAALVRALARRGVAGEVADGLVPGTWRPRRSLTRPGLVSIIIPTCAAEGRIAACIETLRSLTDYRDFEIVCVENIPAKERKWRTWLGRNADRVVAMKEPFNWSRFNNRAAAEAKGEYLLFLNDDIEIIEPEWLDAMLAEAQRPEVGVVGPLLLYPDRRMQHAGMFLAAVGQGRHAFRYAGEHDPGYFGLALTQRNVIAVTGACFLTRRDTFDALGGFDEAHGIINNDVDFCLRAWQRGLAILYTPFARLVHHEAVSRAALDDEYDVAAFDSKWRSLYIAGDPYFSPHLSKAHDHFTIDDEPTEVSITGRPALAREAIRHILVVKLDHIGDCITSFPAVRRLKLHFPQARIAVLTSRASRPVWAFEPTVDKVIEFDFFHARSALGTLEHSEEDWQELELRLSREHFDLAVDLRKHIETRQVLQHTGARYLAGFDHHGQYPWLDIALEWGGDQMSMRKRLWAGDDLVNLVDAVAAACERDRAVIVLPPARAAEVRRQAGAADAPVIWVHPTSGNDIKQWPVEYFAIVIDQLVENHGARIVLTGAPGDEEIAAGIVERLRHKEAVTSMIGSSPLAALPELMAGAALFVGNDSGVKHIAAGLGIATVGIHGGTLDPREWGGVGPNAVSIARNVVCSPCYLAKVEDCRRGVACLSQLEPGRVYDICRRLLLLDRPARPALGPAAAARPAAPAKPRRAARSAAAGAEARS